MLGNRGKVAVAVASGILVLASAGCGGNPAVNSEGGTSSADETYASFDAMDESTRMDELVKAAEKEGTVTVYLRADNVFKELEAAFEKKYNVDLRILNPGTVQVTRQQIMEQSKAGKSEADVVETYAHELNTIYSESNLVSEIPKFLAAAAPDPTLASEFSIESFQYPFLTTWNTNEVKGEDVPRTLTDTSKPFWNDNLVMVKNYEPWYMTEYQRLTAAGMTTDEFKTLFKGIASNSNSADSSNPAAAGIASGQYKAGVGIALVAPQRLGDTAPVAWEPTDDAISVVPSGIGLLKGASHPAAGLLFSHWYLTEGSDILEEEQFVAQNPNEEDLKGAKLERFDTAGLDSEKLGLWRTAYENLLRGSDDVLPAYIK